jgi:hypothetical protein
MFLPRIVPEHSHRDAPTSFPISSPRFSQEERTFSSRCHFLLAGGFLSRPQSLSLRPRRTHLTPNTPMFCKSNCLPVTLFLKRWKVRIGLNFMTKPRRLEHQAKLGQCFPFYLTNLAVHFRHHANGRADVKRLPSRSLPYPMRNKGHPNTQVRYCSLSRMQRMSYMASKCPYSHGQFQTFSIVVSWLCICLLICQSGTPSTHFARSCYPSLKCPHSPPPHPTSQHKHVIVYTAVYKNSTRPLARHSTRFTTRQYHGARLPSAPRASVETRPRAFASCEEGWCS